MYGTCVQQYATALWFRLLAQRGQKHGRCPTCEKKMFSVNFMDEFTIPMDTSDVDAEKEICNILDERHRKNLTFRDVDGWGTEEGILNMKDLAYHMTVCLGAIWKLDPQQRPVVKTFIWFPLHLAYDKYYKTLRLIEVLKKKENGKEKLIRLEFNFETEYVPSSNTSHRVVPLEDMRDIMSVKNTWGLFNKLDTPVIRYKLYDKEKSKGRKHFARFYDAQLEQADILKRGLWDRMWRDMRGEIPDIKVYRELTVPGWKAHISKGEYDLQNDAGSYATSQSGRSKKSLKRHKSKETVPTSSDVTPVTGIPWLETPQNQKPRPPTPEGMWSRHIREHLTRQERRDAEIPPGWDSFSDREEQGVRERPKLSEFGKVIIQDSKEMIKRKKEERELARINALAKEAHILTMREKELLQPSSSSTPEQSKTSKEVRKSKRVITPVERLDLTSHPTFKKSRGRRESVEPIPEEVRPRPVQVVGEEIHAELIAGYSIYLVPHIPNESPERTHKARNQAENMLKELIQRKDSSIRETGHRRSRSPSPIKPLTISEIRKANVELGKRTGITGGQRAMPAKPSLRLNNNLNPEERKRVHLAPRKGVRKGGMPGSYRSMAEQAHDATGSRPAGRNPYWGWNHDNEWVRFFDVHQKAWRWGHRSSRNPVVENAFKLATGRDQSDTYLDPNTQTVQDIPKDRWTKVYDYWYDMTWPGYVDYVPLPPDMNPEFIPYYENQILDRVGAGDVVRKILLAKFQQRRADAAETSRRIEQDDEDRGSVGREVMAIEGASSGDRNNSDSSDSDATPLEYRNSRPSTYRR